MVPLCDISGSGLAELEDEDRDEFMAEPRLEKPGQNRVISAGYSLLNLQTYIAAGVKEIRAWTIQVARSPSGSR